MSSYLMRGLQSIAPMRGEKLTATPILRRRRTLFQSLPVPDPALTRIAGKFEILREFEGIHGTGVLAGPQNMQRLGRK